MIKSIYCIRDVAIGYCDPFCALNDKVAIRDFRNAINLPNTPYNLNPKDYDLMCVASIDLDSGTVVAQQPQLVVSGISLVGVNND
ncbi:nonstructural protein [Capybara microvirus Cap1_SP_141]|nr:nonstructural protein [Capybara microvirus Cap1_SP_141]